MPHGSQQSWLCRYAPFVAAAGLLLVGLALRFDSIAESLWIDEFGTLWVVERDFATMLRRCWDFQGQSPLYYAMPWMSIHIFGESEIALRAPSFVLNAATTVVLCVCAKNLDSPKTGYYAAALFWLAVPSINTSVNARPYALVLFTVTVAIAGFGWAAQTGNRWARMLWIVGGAAVAWAHYVHYPLVLGLMVGYTVDARFRLRYPFRQFLIDGVLQFALVAACIPQILILFTRRGSLSWVDEWNYFAFLPPILAFVPVLLLGLTHPLRPQDTGSIAALRRVLIIALLFQVGGLEVAALLGMNLLSARYFMSVLIPVVLLAALSLARFSKGELVTALALFAVVTAGTLTLTKKVTGTVTGISFEDWRSAVAELSARTAAKPDALVLFRSGFVEEDVMPLGHPSPTTLAPLRSPGRSALSARTVSLTYRWNHPARETYFEKSVVPEINAASRFWAIGHKNYMERLVGWLDARWPSRFEIVPTDFGVLQLIEFRRREQRKSLAPIDR